MELRGMRQGEGGETCHEIAQKINPMEFWWDELIEKNHLEDSGICWRILFIWLLKNHNGSVWTGQIWLQLEESG